MIVNGWNVTEERALWMGKTEPDDGGVSHVLVAKVGLEQPAEDAERGLYLRLMLDGEPQAVLVMQGETWDDDHRAFAQRTPAREFVEHAVELVVANRGAGQKNRS